MVFKMNFDGQWIPDVDLPVQMLDLNQRIKRSVKLFFVLLLCALISILIPVLHFFLVPGFLISSIIFSYLKLREVGSLDISHISCPSCKQKFKEKSISIKKNESSIRLHCFNCQKNMTMIISKSL